MATKTTNTKPKPKRQPVGRPTLYNDDMPRRAYKLALLGLTDREIAEQLEINVDTLYRWKREHPEFSDRLNAGKIEADANVARSLYQRAVGYSHPEEKIFCHNGEIIRAETIRQYPPDTRAAAHWLGARRGAQWVPATRQEITGPGGGPIQSISVSLDPHQALDNYLESIRRAALPEPAKALPTPDADNDGVIDVEVVQDREGEQSHESSV
jgi:transposase-like protein